MENLINFLKEEKTYHGSIKKLSEILNMSHSTTWRYLKELRADNTILIENQSSKNGVDIYYLGEESETITLVKRIKEELLITNNLIKSLESHIINKEREILTLKKEMKGIKKE